MDRKIIDFKFESLRRCIDRIESKRPFILEELKTNYDLQDSISVNLERATQNAIGIAALVNAEVKGLAPDTMAECFDALHRAKMIGQLTCDRMKKATGFRNMLVHEYAKIDWKIVLSVITKHLDDFRRFVKEVDHGLVQEKEI